MTIFKTILVPLDFSEPSKTALNCGLGMATRLQAKLILAHIIPKSSAMEYAFPIEDPAMVAKQREKALQEVQALVPDQLREQVDLEIIVRTGQVEEDLLAIVDQQSVDLVLMGSHGRRRFRRWFLGSVAEHMLRRVPVPILTVSHIEPDRHPFGAIASFNRILFATDLGESAAAGMTVAVQLAQAFSGRLTVLTVVEYLNRSYEVAAYLDDERTQRLVATRKQLDAFVEREKPKAMEAQTVVAEGKAYEQILAQASELNADCILLTLQSRSLLERAFLGSTAERVVRLSPIPVLSIPFATSP